MFAILFKIPIVAVGSIVDTPEEGPSGVMPLNSPLNLSVTWIFHLVLTNRI